jgi:hypothetical protein
VTDIGAVTDIEIAVLDMAGTTVRDDGLVEEVFVSPGSNRSTARLTPSPASAPPVSRWP